MMGFFTTVLVCLGLYERNLVPFLHSTPPVKTPSSSWPSIDYSGRTLAPATLKALRNTTLGFQQVFLLNLPSRTDKLDAFSVASSLTDFNFSLLPGIDGSTVPDKALPATWNDGPLRNNQVGCWRAHLNVAQTIVRQRLSSAMIFEDDADWDVNYREQLVTFAMGSQMILGSPAPKTLDSPYGDGWDLLWLGHCGSSPMAGDDRRFIIENDPTVTPRDNRFVLAPAPAEMESHDNTTRIMYRAGLGICAYNYALSLRGAQKLLYYLSMSPYTAPYDLGMDAMCKDATRNFVCIGIFPQLVDSHRAAGPIMKDTDIGMPADDGNPKTKGFSYNVVYSTKLNVNKLLDGKRGEVDSQWPDQMLPLKGPVRTRFRTINESLG